MKAGNASGKAPLASEPAERQLPKKVIAEEKPLWLTPGDVKFLLHLVSRHDPDHHLLPSIRHLKALMEDRVQQLRDLEQTAMADAFWFEGPTAALNGVIGKLKAGRKKGHRKLEANVACPSVRHMREQVLPALTNGKPKEGEGEPPCPTA